MIERVLIPIVFIWTVEGRMKVFDGQQEITEAYYSEDIHEENPYTQETSDPEPTGYCGEGVPSEP